MELTCVVLLTLAGLGAATPHGYGAKGGASSGAVAGASANAFGGSTGPGYTAPVQVAPGYSGSFSKSFSSSSSSSSASSSSSSSSFSFSGTSAGGYPGFGTVGAPEGCRSEGCKIAGAHGSTAAHGSSATHGSNDIGAGLQAYNSANSASTAGAGVNSLTSGGCASGSCQPSGYPESSATRGSNVAGSAVQSYNSANAAATAGAGANSLANGGCASGGCQAGGSDDSSATNSNDIDTNLQAHNAANAASIAGTGAQSGSGCQGYNCNIDTTKLHPHSSDNSDSIQKCTSGNCGPVPSRPSNDKSTADITAKDHTSKYDKESTAYTSAGSDCSNGNCGVSGTGSSDKKNPSTDDDIYAGYQKPSIHLETPHLESACISGNCGPTGYRPSSYNVPIHGSYNPVPKPSCSGGNCDNYQSAKAPNSNSNPVPVGYFNPQESSTDVKKPLPDSVNCAGQSCSASPNQGIPGHPSVQMQPNVGNIPILASKPQLFIPSYNVPAVGNAPSGCSTPSCTGYPSTGSTPGLITPSTSFGTTQPIGTVQPSYTVSAHPQPGHEVSKPGHSEELPSYTGGFGGPAGILKPNELNPVTSKPSQTYHGSAPSHTAGSTSCNTPNCSGYSNAAAAAGAHAQAGTVGVSKPSIDAANVPSYTGGFGGPAGVLKPSGEHSTPSGLSYTQSGAPSYNVPSGSSTVPAPGCSSPRCVGSPIAGATAGANGDSGSSIVIKPSASLLPDSHQLPSFPSGSAGPSEIVKPHHGLGAPNVPSVTPIHPSSPSFDTPSTGSSGCHTPNCGYPTGSTGSLKPGYFAGGYTPDTTVSNSPNYALPSLPQHNHVGNGIPSGCTTPNCDSSATSNAVAGANARTPSVEYTKPNLGEAGKLPTYTGGFGGSAGTLKPIEIGVTGIPGHSPSVSSPAYNIPSVSNCKTPNCGSYPSASAGAASGAHAQPGSYSGAKPIDSDEDLPPYKGGFGGPSGILKPNDYSVPTVGLSPTVYDKPLASSDTPKPASCSSGVCAHTSSLNTHSIASQGAQAIAGATAAAEEVEYTGGFGGPPGVLKPYESDKAGALSTIGKHTVGSHYTPSGSLSKDTTGNGVGSHSTTSQAGALGHGTGVGQGGYVNHGEAGGLSHTGASVQQNGLGVAGTGVLGQAGAISQNSGYGHSAAAGHGYTGANGIRHEGASHAGTPNHADAAGLAGATGLANGLAYAGSVAQAGAISSANSGAIGGYNVPSDVKGSGGCGGGCGGSNSGSFGYSSGIAKAGYLDGSAGSLSSSGSSARSLSSATAFGSSFASAHATAGAGVKGGYGKR